MRLSLDDEVSGWRHAKSGDESELIRLHYLSSSSDPLEGIGPRS